jgi:lysylphosphatidylglycerol synthetase-like protein (DUF2156 family)
MEWHMPNLNLIHNLINLLIAALGAILIASGCVAAATGTLDCTASWIPTQFTVIAITALSVLKVIMNLFRDGLTGLWKVQPPVVK